MVYLTITKWRPPQWSPFLSFYSIRREGRYKRETKYPLHLMGNICLDLRRRDWWGLNSLSSHASITMPTTYYLVLPCTPCTCACAHKCTSYLHFMNFVVHFSTIHFTFLHIIILQIHHVHVQCLHISFAITPLGSLTMAKNLHDTVSKCWPTTRI